MKIIITGFGPFGPFKINPSRIIAQKAVEKLVKDKVQAQFYDMKASIKDINGFYENLHEDDVFVLHMGLYNGLKKLNMEDTAQNNAEFVIPDAEKEQPRNQPIDPNQPISNKLVNSLPIDQWVNQLSQNYDLSHDAGTYVCNYCYYRALLNVDKKIKGALFVHCGLFNDIAEDKQVDSIVQLAHIILNHFK